MSVTITTVVIAWLFGCACFVGGAIWACAALDHEGKRKPAPEITHDDHEAHFV